MLQTLALALYRSRVSQAIMKSGAGRRVFREAYFLYKTREAANARHLRPLIARDDWVIDVGANIGFFTILFAGWLDAGRVLALEPEPRNFRQLEEIVAARGLADRVVARRAAAANFAGEGRLALSAASHADHRLADSGIPVDVDTLDNIWRGYDCPRVSLIKIDVQGAEREVLAGAKKLIAACRPALYVEIDTTGNGNADGHARNLLAALGGISYRPHEWRREWAALSPEQTLARARQHPGGYDDFLFLPVPDPTSR